jgi:hypothetical protein
MNSPSPSPLSVILWTFSFGEECSAVTAPRSLVKEAMNAKPVAGEYVTAR